MSIFCKHKWKEKERHKISRVWWDGEKVFGLMIIQECTKCGKLKKVSFP